MKDMLTYLFQSDLHVELGRAFETRYILAEENAASLESLLKEKLAPEQRELLEDYLQKAKICLSLNSQLEFERGFCMAGKLLFELFIRWDGIGPKNEG